MNIPCTFRILMYMAMVHNYNCIAITFIFHSFVSSLARSRYLSFFSLSFSFALWSAGTAKSTIQQFLFLFLIITWSGRLAEFRWSVCISKPQTSLSFILSDGFWVVRISFVHMVKFKLLAQLQVDPLVYLVMSSLIIFLH